MKPYLIFREEEVDFCLEIVFVHELSINIEIHFIITWHKPFGYVLTYEVNESSDFAPFLAKHTTNHMYRCCACLLVSLPASSLRLLFIPLLCLQQFAEFQNFNWILSLQHDIEFLPFLHYFLYIEYKLLYNASVQQTYEFAREKKICCLELFFQFMIVSPSLFVQSFLKML